MSIGNVSKTLTCDSLCYVFVLMNNDNLLIEEIISKFWAKAKINIIEQFFQQCISSCQCDERYI